MAESRLHETVLRRRATTLVRLSSSNHMRDSVCVHEHLKVLEAARVFILPTASDGCDEPLLGLSDCGPWRFASSASVCMPLRSPSVWLHRAREVVFMPMRQRSSIWIANQAQEGFATGSRRSSHSEYRLRQWRHGQRRLRDVCITQSPLNQLSDIVTQLRKV